jgi:hypothetical protein
MEIRKVLGRKDGIKMVIIPKKSDIKVGEYVSIKSMEVKHDRGKKE